MLAANVLCIKKKKKKRSYFVSDSSEIISSNNGKDKRHKSSSMLHITEDTPADMLAGAMDLTIHLPSGKTSKMCVERSTPMMDLLVQITTNHQLQITNYTLQPLQTAPNSGYSDKVLSYYPNTPIGALDTQHVRVVPKIRTLPVQKNIPPGHQPFESTFRMKVHLPRNQLYVTRVSRHVHIEDIMRKVCEEKNLDPNKCEVRHPGNLDEVLDPKLTLNDYMITEIYLILKGSNSFNQAFSSNDIMALRKEEERKQMHNKTGGGVFNLIFRRGKSNTGSGSISTTENSISPTHSDDSRSTTPPVAPPPIILPPKRDPQTEKPKAPQRKRRPAPKPPQPVQKEPVELRISPAVSDTSGASDIISKNETNIMICHSRHSSDSSGYHETSILSDHCNTSLSRRNRLEEGESTGRSLNRHSESVGNLTKMTTQFRSTSSLAIPGRKKKAAPPPPKILQSSTTNLEEPSPVVASQIPVNSSKTESLTSCGSQINRSKLEPEDEIKVEGHTQAKVLVEEEKEEILETPYSHIEANEIIMNDIQRYISYEKSPQDSGNSSDISEKSKLDEEILNEDEKVEEETEEWELPSPPKAFKDIPSCLTEKIEGAPATEPVISPELLEKLKQIEEQQVQQTEDSNNSSDNSSTISEDRPILSKLTLENLEKRKSLVYNRELATSLKLYDSDLQNTKKYQSDMDLSKTYNQFEETLEEIRKVDEQNKRNIAAKLSNNRSTLPNFKITTYDEPKQKIKVFEDDTIRSNSEATKKSVTLNRAQSLQKTSVGRSMENVSMRQEVFKRPRDVEHRKFRPKSEYIRSNVNRSESFSVDQNEWSPSKPVTRSKSQMGFKREEGYGSPWKPETMSKSSSLFDVSGLQSLEVMRKIQDKLNTPTNSIETLNRIGTEKPDEPKYEREEIEVTTRRSQYSGPPSINMGTWSERPRIPVSVKEDEDYKLGQRINRTNTNYGLNSRVEIRHSTGGKLFNIPDKTDNHQSVSIKLNGSESISSQRNGNVIIKIGEQPTKDSQEVMYRSSVDKKLTTQRPHSVAFPTDFDISRVPIVRSVELKKTFKDTSNNTSVTHLNQPNDKYLSNNESTTNKPVFRTKSFLQQAPVVKGFRNISQNNETNNSKPIRHSWQPNTSSIVSKQENFTTNQNVPFSKFNLRRTESKKIVEDNCETSNGDTAKIPVLVNKKKEVLIPIPPPPQMPKIVQKKISNRQFVPVVDPREELLKSIRDFGGKKGLKSMRA